MRLAVHDGLTAAEGMAKAARADATEKLQSLTKVLRAEVKSRMKSDADMASRCESLGQVHIYQSLCIPRYVFRVS